MAGRVTHCRFVPLADVQRKGLAYKSSFTLFNWKGVSGLVKRNGEGEHLLRLDTSDRSQMGLYQVTLATQLDLESRSVLSRGHRISRYINLVLAGHCRRSRPNDVFHRAPGKVGAPICIEV